jgi:hypothetical protein
MLRRRSGHSGNDCDPFFQPVRQKWVKQAQNIVRFNAGNQYWLSGAGAKNDTLLVWILMDFCRCRVSIPPISDRRGQGQFFCRVAPGRAATRRPLAQREQSRHGGPQPRRCMSRFPAREGTVLLVT